MVIKIYRRIIKSLSYGDIDKESVLFLFETHTLLKFAELII